MARILLIVLTLGIQLYGLIDCAQRDDSEVKVLPRWGWILIIMFLPTIGAIGYLIVGRPKRPGNGGGKRKRTIAPDDDPDFLRGL
jgi:hypothetical protein